MHAKSIALAALLVLGTAAPMTTTMATQAEAAGLKSTDVKVGTGPVAKAGQTVTVNYTGWLYENGTKGAKFDSSLDHGQPFSFPLGGGKVIPGWDQGVAGMKVGGERTLIIPPELGYGPMGTPGGPIPPNATLMFDVQLLKVGS
jgi:FKBP-type peptidyl-prolyl cis-trans isomerase